MLAIHDIIFKLCQELPFINDIVFIQGILKKIGYTTSAWITQEEVEKVMNGWSSLKLETLLISDRKYRIHLCTIDRLVGSSINNDGHIIGVRDNVQAMLALIEPDGIIPFTTMEMSRALASFNLKKSGLEEKLGPDSEKRIKERNNEKGKSEKEITVPEDDTDIPFTARLMAHYRALENKKEKPLFIDPFAERLAGQLSSYLERHLRVSEMDYPIVRSYYIDEQLLKPWCACQSKSQIVILGAGLDTRAYRLEYLKEQEHSIFEVDFLKLIQYKEEVLEGENPYCKLVRLSIDLSRPNWKSHLIKGGFSAEVPTFWILEGLVYYIKKDLAAELIRSIAELSTPDSELFVDLMVISRWFQQEQLYDEKVSGPFARHLKWGIDMRSTPPFFKELGWDVECSYADEFDQSRDVGQRAMIFIRGKKN